MKVPLSLLKEYIPLSIPASQIAEVLTLAGIEVDGIDQVGGSFSGVVVAEVKEAVRHPTADRLAIASVFDGTQTFQVVCGAPNCRAGIKVAFARIGAKLTGADGKEFQIKKAKLRDVESFGMLCSSDELQLGESGGKILELSDELPLGIDVASIYSDEIFSLSLTPNLGHCLSIQGIARELAAHLEIPFKKRVFSCEETSGDMANDLRLEVVDRKHCARYAAKIVKKVQIGPSPDWLKRKIEACGMRSINSAVDIANLVMCELGQPLHMFDLKKVSGGKIIVTSHIPIVTENLDLGPGQNPGDGRSHLACISNTGDDATLPSAGVFAPVRNQIFSDNRYTPYTHLTTLDGVDRLIPEGALLICDSEKPLAFAGIMGGLSSAITEGTTEILIEAANFSFESIRKTARLLGLKTEASSRFEKGVDLALADQAVCFAADLLAKVAGGEVAKGIEDHLVHPIHLKKISLRKQRVNQLLGLDLSISEIASLLERLQITVCEESANQITLQIPSFRNDLQKEIDLIEEVARVYGYQKIPVQAPRQRVSSLLHAPSYEMEVAARSSLKELGLQEWMTCDLISPELAQGSLMHGMKEESVISVLCPASIQQSVLRTTLLPGLIQVAKYNIDRGSKDLAGFEVGRIHFKEGEHYLEPSVAGILLTGSVRPYHFDPKPKEVDFLDLKGVIQNFCARFFLENLRFEVSHFSQLHPGRQAKFFSGEVLLGVLGEVHPSYREKEGIDQRVFFAQVSLQELISLCHKDKTVKPISLFPGSERDWTVTVGESLAMDTIFHAIEKTRSPLLDQAFLLDLYKSSQIGEDKKNVTLRFLYKDKEKTLSFEEVEKEHARMVRSISERIGLLSL